MALWKKNINGLPPDDPPKEQKLYNDSLELYNHYKKTIEGERLTNKTSYLAKPQGPTYFKIDKPVFPSPKEKINEYNSFSANRIKNYSFDKHWNNAKNDYNRKVKEYELAKNINRFTNKQGDYTGNLFGASSMFVGGYPALMSNNISPIGYTNIYATETAIPIYKKPTGNALKQQKNKLINNLNTSPNIEYKKNYYPNRIETIFQRKPLSELSKVPIIKPEPQSSLIKFRPPTPLPQGNVELQNTGYTSIGIKKKPDGTRFIYDRSGKTDKTVTIDDNRIGFEYYIKKLYE